LPRIGRRNEPARGLDGGGQVAVEGDAQGEVFASVGRDGLVDERRRVIARTSRRRLGCRQGKGDKAGQARRAS